MSKHEVKVCQTCGTLQVKNMGTHTDWYCPVCGRDRDFSDTDLLIEVKD